MKLDCNLPKQRENTLVEAQHRAETKHSHQQKDIN